MTPEKQHFQEQLGLKNYTPEQLEKVKTELKSKIDTLKADGSFSGEDLFELANLIDGKDTLSPTEAELKEHLETLNNLNNQIDFLMALVEIGGEAENNNSENTKENKENSDENKKINEPPSEKSEKNNIKEYNNVKIENNDPENIKDLKKIYNTKNPSIDKENQEIEYFKKIIEIYNWAKKYEDKSYIGRKIEKLNTIINKILARPEKDPRNSDVLGMKLEAYEIYTIKNRSSYYLEKNNERSNNPKEKIPDLIKEGRELYNKDLSNEDYLKKADIAELIALLEYTNRNFKEIDDKWVRFGKDDLGSLDNKEEIFNFQKRIISKIEEKKQDYELEFGFDNKNTGYTVNIKSIARPQSDPIENQSPITNNKNNFMNSSEIEFLKYSKMKEGEETKTEEKIDELKKEFNNKVKNLKNNINNDINNNEFQILCIYTKKEEKDIINRLKEYIKQNNITLNLNSVNPEIIDELLNDKEIKIDKLSYLTLPINDNFLKNVNLYNIFNRILNNKDIEKKKYYIENIMQKIYAEDNYFHERDKFEELGDLKNNEIIKNIINKFKKIDYLLKEGDALDEINKTKNYNELINLSKRIDNSLKSKPIIIDKFIEKITLFKENGENNIKISDFMSLQNNLNATYYLLYKTGTNIDKGKINNSFLDHNEINKIIYFSLKEYSMGNSPVLNLNKSDSEESINDNDKKTIQEMKNLFDGIVLTQANIDITNDIKDELNEKEDKEDKEKNSLENHLKSKLEEDLKKFGKNDSEINNIINKILNIKDENIFNFSSELGNLLFENFKEQEVLEIRSFLDKTYRIIIDYNNNKKEELKNKINIDIDTDQIARDFINSSLPLNIDNLKDFINKKNINLDEETINTIFKIIEIEKTNNNINKSLNNIDIIIEYSLSGDTGSFEEYVEKKGYTLKDKDGNIINKIQIVENNGFNFNNGIVYNKNYGIDIEKGEFLSKNGEEVKLSSTEKEMIKSNPEIAKNIINLYESLEKVGLKKLWNYKEQIFKSIENTFNFQFERKDGNYLDEREIKILLNSILVSIGEQPLKTSLNMEAFLTEIENRNGKQITGTEEQINNYSETKFESLFIEKFVGRGDMIGFKQGAFEASLK